MREALQAFMKPEDVEEELRKAIDGLNLEEPAVDVVKDDSK